LHLKVARPDVFAIASTSAVRHRSRMEAVLSGTANPDTFVSPKAASRTAGNNNLARGKSEKKGQKIYNLSSQHIQNTATLEEQNQTKPFLMVRLPSMLLRHRRWSKRIR
jgi:hypothetical protein